MESEEKGKELEKQREEDEPDEKGEEESEQIPSYSLELPASAKRVIKEQEKLNRTALDMFVIDKFNLLHQWFEPVRSSIREAQRIMKQPHIIEAVKRMQETLQVVGDITKEDDKVKKHNENPQFWINVKKVSQELVILPIGTPDEVLDYMDTESCDVDEVKRMLGEFDVMTLEKELEAEEHQAYTFKNYLQEIIKLHQANPDNYRVSTPALFVIIEGTLGEMFKISEEGTASEIKQKMNIFWDIYAYVNEHQVIGSAFSFWHQFLLANTKGVFNQLTVNSKESGVMLNRNAVLHGKSNPDDWTIEDFETLLKLLNVTLFMRQTADFITKDFDVIIHDELYEKEQLIFKEFEQAIRLTTNKGQPKKFKRGDVNTIRKELMTDLSHIFGYGEETQELILKKSNFHEIEQRLLSREGT